MARTIRRKDKLRQLWKVGRQLKEPLQTSNIAFNMLGNHVKQLTFTGIDFYEGAKSWHELYNKELDEKHHSRRRKVGHSLLGEKRYIKALLQKKALQADTKVRQLLNLDNIEPQFNIPKAKT